VYIRARTLTSNSGIGELEGRHESKIEADKCRSFGKNMTRPTNPASADALSARVNVATRCFRDIADDDYIAARAAYRARLVVPFLWSSLQAIEKYLKCILIVNDVSTHKLGHDIKAALRKINQRCPFSIQLNSVEQEIFDHVARYGPDRYLIYSYFIADKELLKLDMLVWHLRQYCRHLNSEITVPTGKKSILAAHLQAIEASWKSSPIQGHIPTGRLEAILRDKNHPSRPALIWKNMRYASRFRRHVPFRSYSVAVNAPLWLRPGVLSHIQHLVQLSKEDVRRYTTHWRTQHAKRKT
jgi:HEPN domain-containing protein